jgi:hypothetical protein
MAIICGNNALAPGRILPGIEQNPAHAQQKKFHNRSEKIASVGEGGPDKRIVTAIISGSMALAVLTTPALAKHSDAQKANDKPVPTGCHAYERAADGSSIALPCGEVGSSGLTQPKSATHETGHQTR